MYMLVIAVYQGVEWLTQQAYISSNVYSGQQVTELDETLSCAPFIRRPG